MEAACDMTNKKICFKGFARYDSDI